MAQLQLDLLLAPLAGSGPAGENLFYDPVFDRIREAVREENPHLSQGVWETDVKEANWIECRDLCIEILEQRSKDLRVAVWLTHALIELDGVAGLVAGLQLIVSLRERFFDGFYPEDPEHRVAAFEWLDVSVAKRVKSLCVSAPEVSELQSYTWADREMALFLEKQGQSPDDDSDSPYVSHDRIRQSMHRTPALFYKETVEGLQAALHIVEGLRSELSSAYGDDAPGFTSLREGLEEMKSFFTAIRRDREPALFVEEADGTAADVPNYADDPEETVAGRIRNRVDAYRRLREAADFLFRTEPHSPAPYLIQRAIVWGDMPLSELLLEILRDNQDIHQVYRLLGIPHQQ